MSVNNKNQAYWGPRLPIIAYLYRESEFKMAKRNNLIKVGDAITELFRQEKKKYTSHYAQVYKTLISSLYQHPILLRANPTEPTAYQTMKNLLNLSSSNVQLNPSYYSPTICTITNRPSLSFDNNNCNPSVNSIFPPIGTGVLVLTSNKSGMPSFTSSQLLSCNTK